MTQRLILISGGIGSGKSAVGAALAARGMLVIDADSVGHEVLEPGTAAHASVMGRWPEVMIGDVIDRRALGRIVFADPEELAALEAITHPAIRRDIRARVEAAPRAGVAVELPLLTNFLGEGWTRVVVDVPDEIRRERLRSRGLDQDEIATRMAAQPSRDEWLAEADQVIDNAGDLGALEAEIDRIVRLVLGDSSTA